MDETWVSFPVGEASLVVRSGRLVKRRLPLVGEFAPAIWRSSFQAEHVPTRSFRFPAPVFSVGRVAG